MKKTILFFLLLTITINAYGIEKNLYHTFKDYPEIKVHFEEVISEADHPNVNIRVFEEIFNNVLPQRIGIKFVPVASGDLADVIIKANIKDHAFTEKAMPLMFSAMTLVADSTTPKSAAKLVVDYQIIDPKTGEIISEFKAFTTQERRPIKDMEDEKAFKHVATKNVNRFLYRAFYEQKKKSSITP